MLVTKLVENEDHNQLIAFQLADEIALMTFKITKQFPKEEICGLVSQMR